MVYIIEILEINIRIVIELQKCSEINNYFFEFFGLYGSLSKLMRSFPILILLYLEGKVA